MSDVVLKKYLGEAIGNYIKHQLRWLKYLTLTVFYEGCCFNFLTTEEVKQEEIEIINQMIPEDLFEFLENKNCIFLVHSIGRSGNVVSCID